MVSVADEGGSLVLMGVDATYCVVDEVDTTSSGLQDIFLQEAIESANVNNDLHSHGAVENLHDDGLTDPCLQEVVKATAENVVKATDGMWTKRKKRKRKLTGEGQSGRVKVMTKMLTETTDMGSRNITVVMPAAPPQSTFLRAALMGKPVSLREPGLPGRLNFCLQREGSPAELRLQRHGDSPPESREGSPSDSEQDQRLSLDGSTTKHDQQQAAGDMTSNHDNKDKPQKTSAKAKKPRSREKHYQCGVCERWFGCKSHVVEHMRTHTGEKPYKCPLCDRSFSQKSNIYQHMNTHTLERPFRCDDCGKDFMYRGSLYKHKRLHTGERPYCCGICSWRFTHASQLFEHLRTHTNEKPFKCGVCGRAFAHSGTMHRHQRNHFNHLAPKVEGAGKEAASMLSSGRRRQQDADEQQVGDDGTVVSDTSKDISDGTAVSINNESGRDVGNMSHATDVSTDDQHNTTSRSGDNVDDTPHTTSAAADADVQCDQNPAAVPGTEDDKTTAITASHTEREKLSHGKVKVTSRPGSESKSGDPKKIFTCDLCNKTFAHKRSVRRHKVSCHSHATVSSSPASSTVVKDTESVSGADVHDDEVQSRPSPCVYVQNTSTASDNGQLTGVPATNEHLTAIPTTNRQLTSTSTTNKQSSNVTSTTTTSSNNNSNNNNNSVIRLLLSRSPANHETNDAGYVSKLIFGNCPPPTAPHFCKPGTVPVVEQNNNDPSSILLKHLLAATAADSDRGDHQGLSHSAVFVKRECDAHDRTQGKSPGLGVQNQLSSSDCVVSSNSIKQEPADVGC